MITSKYLLKPFCFDGMFKIIGELKVKDMSFLYILFFILSQWHGSSRLQDGFLLFFSLFSHVSSS